ncbi:hypothetical protein LTR53_010212 [Teratosphaeriaceae sp. CCFEE 6253]|nr:hypothetical protein LTR53_010212 [Teratosphaeriaceae sp. CCFEE 6253]
MAYPQPGDAALSPRYHPLGHEKPVPVGSRTHPLSKPRTCLAVLRHTLLGWVSWLLATALFALTVAYALKPSTFTAGLYFVGDSIGHSILTLRLLSAFTDILLSITFAIALDRLQAVLVSGSEGTAFAKVLAVHPGISYVGLSVLGFGRGTSQLAVRVMAVVRLFVVVLIPILGIIILSDVSTRQAFDHLTTYTLSTPEGMSFFNASRAPIVALEIDRIFSTGIVTFLSDSEHSVDITPNDQRSMSCAQLSVNGQTPTCERTVFLPGAVPVGLVLDGSTPEADVQTVFDIKGYVLRYGAGDANGDWAFDPDTQCQTLGLAQGAARLCLANPSPNVIRARMISCPTSLATQGQACLSNTSWHLGNAETPIVTTTLTTTFRRADVAFHRANSSIAWHNFLDKPEEDAPLSASDLLSAYADFALGTGSVMQAFQDWSAASNTDTTDSADTSTSADTDSADTTTSTMSSDASSADLTDLLNSLLNSSSTPSDSTTSNSILLSRHHRTTKRQLDGLAALTGLTTALPGSAPIFPLLPYTYLQSCSVLAARNPGTRPICTDFLQNFLAVPLLWCDDTLLLRSQGGGSFDVTGGLIGTADGASTGGGSDRTTAQVRDFLAYLGIDDASTQRLGSGLPPTKVALSRLRYEIVVGRASLIAYTAIAAGILLLCFVILAVATRDLAGLGYWPLWESAMKYDLRYKGHPIDEGVKEMARDLRPGERREMMEWMRVKVH